MSIPFNVEMTENVDIFTNAQKKILPKVCEGKSDKQIAIELMISERTVHAQMGDMLQRADLKNKQNNARCTLIATAFFNGWVRFTA
jgi:DNA-binding NarL/FixJ family response regulator